MSIAGIYCEPDNIERHVELETDGMVWCQHCYQEAKHKIKQLEVEKQKLMELVEAYREEGRKFVTFNFPKTPEK